MFLLTSMAAAQCPTRAVQAIMIKSNMAADTGPPFSKGAFSSAPFSKGAFSCAPFSKGAFSCAPFSKGAASCAPSCQGSSAMTGMLCSDLPCHSCLACSLTFHSLEPFLRPGPWTWKKAWSFSSATRLVLTSPGIFPPIIVHHSLSQESHWPQSYVGFHCLPGIQAADAFSSLFLSGW